MDRVKCYDYQSEQKKYADTADNNVQTPSALSDGWKKVE